MDANGGLGMDAQALSRHLERIAVALERIADHLDGEAVESIITVTPGPFKWDDAAEGFVHATPSKPGRPEGRTSHCGRCGRADTRRMNHSNSCRECLHEPWWDE